MILPIVAYGDNVLRTECEEIDADYPELSKLLEDMFETMYRAQGVGLAAPQIGLAIRIFIVDGSPFADDEPELENFKKIFINPIMEDESGKKWSFNEGCLSIPGVREDVSRHSKITINYLDENFNEIEETYEGIAARIIQHEYDHIEGVLFTDYLNPLKRKMIKRKLNDISKGNVKVDYKMRFPLAKRR